VKAVVRRRSGARRDLVETYRYFAREAGLSIARRFLAEAEATFERLARAPGIGARYEPENPAFGELRFSPVRRFKNHLVFYRPIEGGIEVARVLHGARDLTGLLEGEAGDDPGGEDPAPAAG
jgi:toxin ParE1/3/4